MNNLGGVLTTAEIKDYYVNKESAKEILRKIKETYVQQEDGKDLSANDFTDDLKAKLEGIEDGANNYELPAATEEMLGGVVIGDNITVTKDGTISVTSEDIVSALGYKPESLTEADELKAQIEADIASAVASAGHLKRKIVDELPAEDEDIDEDTIYMVVADAESENNKYVEYLYINNAWEKIGDTDVDLSNYLQKDEMVAITTDEIDSMFDEVQGD